MRAGVRTAVLFAGVVAHPGETELAQAAGDMLGAARYGLRHGGYNGLMEAAARGAARHGVPVTAVTLDTYFVPYRLTVDPQLLKETAAALAQLLPPNTQAVAGPALAGISLATAVSLHTGLPAAYVRPAPSTHGTWRQIEDTDLDGRHTALIDDTARSGTSLLRTARLLRIAGAKVTAALCVLDRDAGATALLAEHRLTPTALLTDPGRTS